MKVETAHAKIPTLQQLSQKGYAIVFVKQHGSCFAIKSHYLTIQATSVKLKPAKMVHP